jgi:uncharacterized protein
MNRRDFIRELGAAGAALAWGGAARAETPALKPVPKRRLGRHAEEVSCIALGGHTLGTAKDVDEAIRIAHEAIDLGLTFFDNAWEYNEGRSEEWMGRAIEDRRDKIFLMTKVCTHGKGRDAAMKILEESLKRLRTDRLDLWMIHQLENEQEIESAFGPGGVIEALEEARRQGKIRYTGFTGHRSADIHLKMLERNYAFDAVIMPLSAFAPNSHQFEDRVLPELKKQGIAPLGIKSLGGKGKVIEDGLLTAEEAVRYVLGLDIAAQIVGINTLEQLRGHVATARDLKPLSADQRAALRKRVTQVARAGRHAPYQLAGYRDGLGAPA